ncbi:MAG TPA: cation-translocating P-type ATPase [Acetobacteraceae bacterium]|nr:cation-translocating P-type ATPase [Acetobacteraceae bacterium]
MFETLTAEETAAQLGTDLRRGLAADAVAERRARYGPNALQEGARRGAWRMLAEQFADFMILLLIVAAIVSGVVGDIEDTLVILGIVVLNAVVGFVQEYRAERVMAALQRMAPPQAVVVRDGTPRSVPAEALVPGDLLLLEAGNAVPADLRLTEAVDLRLGEAALTGESLPAEKTTAPRADPALPLGDRRNMAFKGTDVLYGRARGVVVATGMATELGRIASLLQGAGSLRTPLQQRLAVFGRQIAIAAIAICVLVFFLGVWRGEPPLLMLLTALSLAVAAVPEAMPAVVTVLLALGAGRMAKAKALVRRLPAVETLGSVTTICSDKTGTLTRNEMRVTDLWLDGNRVARDAPDPAAAAALWRAMALCNDVSLAADGSILGEPTEIALWQAAAEAGARKAALEATAPRLADLPFDSERKRMTTLHAEAGEVVAYVKGAPESMLPRCRALATATGEVPLDLPVAMQAAETMARDGLRVLALARRRWNTMPADRGAEAVERDLTLLGLVGLLDPPRPEAAQAVATCRAAGITPVMITGDHPATAQAIARRIGVLDDDAGALLTGRDLATLPDAELDARVRTIRVYARVDPAQKIRIVTALQRAGEIVAMTGDGVNDAPALARADIGVAMGRIGTDVAREAASLVLLDDNFATVVVAVQEGRRIDDNIRKFIRFVMTCNLAEILTILLAPLFGMPVPLLPIQILWINLVTDGLPGLALAAEPAEPDVMRRKPRPPRAGVFTRGMLRHVIWVGLLMTALTLGTQAVAMGAGMPHWRGIVFTVLTLVQMAQVLGIRSERASLLQLAVIYVPALNPIFATEPLSLTELLACCAISATVLVVIECDKWLANRRIRGDARA